MRDPRPISVPHSPPPSNARVVDAIAHVLEREGRVCFRAQGASMMPAVWPGCWITVVRCAASELAPGELALIRSGDRLVLHRVVATGPASVITRGDAHGYGAPSDPRQVLGHVPGLVAGRRHFPAFPERVLRPLRAVYLQGLPWIRRALRPALRGYTAARRRTSRR